MASTPLIDTRSDIESLTAKNIVGLRPSHKESCATGARGVAHNHSQSENGCNGTSLNVGNAIVGETPKHQEL